jgi:hypothetical protein
MRASTRPRSMAFRPRGHVPLRVDREARLQNAPPIHVREGKPEMSDTPTFGPLRRIPCDQMTLDQQEPIAR